MLQIEQQCLNKSTQIKLTCYSFLVLLNRYRNIYRLSTGKQHFTQKNVNTYSSVFRDGSFEHPQHMLWLINKKISFSYSILHRDLHISNRSCLGIFARSDKFILYNLKGK